MKAGLIAAVTLAAAPAYAQQRIAPETWITAADYPPIRGDGAVYLEYAVTPEGRVSGCSVRLATVPAQLAETACARLIERARYIPAFDAAGQPVAGRDTIAVNWNAGAIRIPGNSDFGGALPASPPGSWITDDDLPDSLLRQKSVALEVPMEFEIGVDGLISTCRAPNDVRPRDIGAYSCRLLVKRARFEMPRGRDGAPFATQGRSSVTWRVSR